jgi:hypothetical protein
MNFLILRNEVPQAAVVITLVLASAFLSSCSSDKPKKIKSAEELGYDAVSHRVFYEGWRHPTRHPEQDSFFYGER